MRQNIRALIFIEVINNFVAIIFVVIESLGVAHDCDNPSDFSKLYVST